MTNRITRHPYFYYSICLLVVTLFSARAGAQTFPEPVREHLLNGLNVIFIPRPGDPNVLLKLRIHSGAVFDTAGKGGSMALLGDVLFPDPTTREYVAEQLGGKLDVVTNYDGIDVTISGNGGELERMVEFLRGALVNTQLTPENIANARESKLKQLAARPPSPAEAADREIAARLFGTFPYGHPPTGTLETVAKVDRADLLHARERFLNADNATLVVIGGVEPSRLKRALRQLLGPWQKGDRLVPATFRQAIAPDVRVGIIDQPDLINAEIRLALRGLSRSDRDAPAAALLAQIVRERWQAAAPDISKPVVRHDAHILPGSFVLGAAVPTAYAAKAISAAQKTIRSMLSDPPTAAELERARGEMLSEIAARTAKSESLADMWLDLETFKLPPLADQINAVRSLTVADIQRVAQRLFKDAATATIIVGDSEKLVPQFDGQAQGAKKDASSKEDVQQKLPAKKP
jgi:zinc protease